MDGLTVRWKYNSSHDPLVADFQIGQEGHNIVPHTIVKLNASSIAFESEHVTGLLGPSAFVRIWNADWIDTMSVKELAKVSGFTLTTATTLVSMTSSIPLTTITRPGTVTGSSVSNGSQSITEKSKTTGTLTAIPDPMLEEISPALPTSAKAGIGVSISVGTIMIIAAAAFLFVRNRRKQATREDVQAELPVTPAPKKVAVMSEPAELQSASTTKHESYELPA
ncbi:hypothetical protein BDV38DRAFT_287309 [Aspergillus pseudotamarii]|uniref:Mid2 domain-containing protein n=1 Tax=Aspergillus pseudotamarii TaxID=132259 RepID=A0A5N6SH17_ASPPS|nr:uncharacterized protein BDV38DRAFT_287309 [Aspergillus pseudotamarii]KAE8132961.1 hypothetical protein BDV38DRAFT_287309 [Aspergillus pseudotamarii]